MNTEAAAADFPDSWRETLKQMEMEWNRLQQENAKLRSERDQLSKAMVALLREDVTLSEAEILAQTGREKPLRDLLQELRAQIVER